MKSKVDPAFWRRFNELPAEAQELARPCGTRSSIGVRPAVETAGYFLSPCGLSRCTTWWLSVIMVDHHFGPLKQNNFDLIQAA
jgi:hypothetical protein